MKFVTIFFSVYLLSFFLIGCSKEDLQEYEAGVTCDTNHTAVVVFENRSASGKTYDILWNGVKVATLKPGEKTRAEAYSTGSHTYVFKKSGTTTSVCTPGYPNLAQCSSYTFWCEQ